LIAVAVTVASISATRKLGLASARRGQDEPAEKEVDRWKGAQSPRGVQCMVNLPIPIP
jgi:hypothetical protein